MRTLKIIAQVAWVASLLVLGTLVGVTVGWTNHGWPGAVVTGTIGFAVGAFFAASPSTFFQLLR
jgi:uncharacterized membrane protein HdeD (DUF308 family)